MRANQLRLWFAAMAYIFLSTLRRIALALTRIAMASGSPHTARLREKLSRPSKMAQQQALVRNPGQVEKAVSPRRPE